MSEPFVGEIRMVGFPFAPRYWANADGQMMQITENEMLFSLYGTIYGGDGRTTFGLPDFRGRVPIHTGQGTGLPGFEMGQAGGAVEVPLSVQEMPSHTHGAQVHASSQAGDQATPQDHYWAVPSRTTPFRADHDSTMSPDAVEVEDAGGGQGHPNMQPFLTVRFCVSLDGVYPQRT